MNIIDVGCSEGVLSENLARLEDNVTAIDACEENIVLAKIRADSEIERTNVNMQLQPMYQRISHLKKSSNEWCSICFVEFETNDIKLKHFISKQHKKKAAANDVNQDFKCAICCQNFNSANQLKYHLQSNRHFTNVNKNNKYKTYINKKGI